METYIEKALNGDAGAYEYIVRQYQNQIFRYINKLIQDPEDAKEVTQDVFITGFYKLEMYNDEYALSTWFYRIAKNLTMNRIKKNKRNRSLVERLSIVTLPKIHQTDSEESYSDSVEYALNLLNDEDKNILILKSVEELSYKELSLIYGVGESALRKRFERARRKFRSVYKEGSDESLCQN